MKLSDLFKRDRNTLEEIAAARKEIARRRKEIAARLDDIAVNRQASGSPGPARREALVGGTPSDVIALDREAEELAAELRQLDHQALELNSRADQAQRADQAAGLRPAIRRLPDAVAHMESAQQALEEARRELHETVAAIDAGRRAVGPDAPAATDDPALVLRVADLLGLRADPSDPSRYDIHRGQLFDKLGCRRDSRHDPNHAPAKTPELQWPDDLDAA